MPFGPDPEIINIYYRKVTLVNPFFRSQVFRPRSRVGTLNIWQEPYPAIGRHWMQGGTIDMD